MQNGSCGPREVQNPYINPSCHKSNGGILTSSSSAQAETAALSSGGVATGAHATNGSVTVRKTLTVWLKLRYFVAQLL